MQRDFCILIVDDDVTICESLEYILNEEGYEVASAATLAFAKKRLKDKFYNVVMVDLKLPDGSGLELLKEAKKINEETIIMVFTGFASLKSSITAMNKGAFAYFQKPLNIDEVKVIIKKARKMQKLSLDNKVLLKRLKEISLKDPLTGLYNYRYLKDRLSAELKRAKRYILPLSVIMLDIDYFKSVNDVYGHQYGDIILKEFAGCLTDFSRANDIVVRYGGEEFLLLLSDISKEGAVMLGNRLLRTLNKNIFDPEGKRIKIKVSLGLSSFPEDGADTETGLLNLADQALQAAKEMGGNRISTSRGFGKGNLESIVNKGGKPGVYRLKGKLSKMTDRGNQTLLESVNAFARTMEAKDYYTSSHSESMVSIVTEIGRKLEFPDMEIENLTQAVILHDLGKIGVPDRILHKKGKLTAKEYEKIKKHPQIGAEIIRSIHFLSDVVPMVLCHHERFDGLGYSSGLRGEEIPLGARIISVADVYQALTSDRPYRKAYAKKDALNIIKKGSGTQFDPKIVKVFLSIMRKK